MTPPLWARSNRNSKSADPSKPAPCAGFFLAGAARLVYFLRIPLQRDLRKAMIGNSLWKKWKK
jgi:hypothetical protein